MELTTFQNRDEEEYTAEDQKLLAGEETNGNIEVLVKPDIQKLPNMWSKDYIGLYCQYAAVGLLYGSTTTLLPICAYTYEGHANVCANARNISLFAWNIKVFFALLTDIIRPFGMRRKPWMITGWTLALLALVVLALFAHTMSLTVWLMMMMLVQGCLMLSDVPADGYSVELGQLEPPEERGQILATGQRMRFAFSMIAGLIQTFLLNGTSTNSADCPIGWTECWSWGLSVNGYYGLLFILILIITLPVFWMKELDASNIPQHTLTHYLSQLWSTMQDLTTLYLLVFVVGIHSFSNFTNIAAVTMQYYVIKLTSFQSGINTVLSYSALALAVYIFQKYLIRFSWRLTQYGSTTLTAFLGLLWLAPFYGLWGTRNGWFTLFISLDTSFALGLSQILYSMAIIELAKPGLEATTYELVLTSSNAGLLVNGILCTQLQALFKAESCNDGDGQCPTDSVSTVDIVGFEASHGPSRFAHYTMVLTLLGLISCLIFTPFLPASSEECHVWKRTGEVLGSSSFRGGVSLFIASLTILYGLVAAALLLNPETSCLQIVGGKGCL